MKVEELIEKLNKIGKDKRISLASNENLEIVFDEICIEQLNDKFVLFGLEGSEDF